MKLIVGLGNPGQEYNYTRHNTGFMVLDYYLDNPMYQEKFNALYIKKTIKNEIVYFIKPLTFMNLSGQAVRQYASYFNIDPKDILVIQDDLDQDFGHFKLKKNSSSGGHNGIKNIIQELGTDEFARLKIGIKNEYLHNVIDFVLNKFSKEELNTFQETLPTYKKIIDSFIEFGIDKTMNIYNTK